MRPLTVPRRKSASESPTRSSSPPMERLDPQALWGRTFYSSKQSAFVCGRFGGACIPAYG